MWTNPEDSQGSEKMRGRVFSLTNLRMKISIAALFAFVGAVAADEPRRLGQYIGGKPKMPKKRTYAPGDFSWGKTIRE